MTDLYTLETVSEYYFYHGGHILDSEEKNCTCCRKDLAWINRHGFMSVCQAYPVDLVVKNLHSSFFPMGKYDAPAVEVGEEIHITYFDKVFFHCVVQRREVKLQTVTLLFNTTFRQLLAEGKISDP